MRQACVLCIATPSTQISSNFRWNKKAWRNQEYNFCPLSASQKVEITSRNNSNFISVKWDSNFQIRKEKTDFVLSSQVSLQKALDESQQKSETIAKLEDTVRELQSHVVSLDSKLRSEETIRRELHNTIQELKGNIRVFCRVRPVLASEEGQRLCTFSFAQDERELAIESTSANEVRD